MWLASSDVLVTTTMNLETAVDMEPYLSASDDRYYLSGRSFPEQTRHNYYEVLKGRIPEFCVLASGTEAICLLVCSASCTHTHYPMTQKMNLLNAIHLEEL